jgi:hypothetical protein
MERYWTIRCISLLFLLGCPTPRGAAVQVVATAPQEAPLDPNSPLDASFWILSDSQIHDSTAGAALVRSGYVDKNISGSAIRPPSLDAWSVVSLRTFVEAMRADAPKLPIFFAGDAADISCTSEYHAFISTMDIATKYVPSSNQGDSNHESYENQKDPPQSPWFMVLGNHDGFYMGNLSYPPDIPRKQQDDIHRFPPGDKTWSGACYTHDLLDPDDGRLIDFEQKVLLPPNTRRAKTHGFQRSLSKALAILMYLDHLYSRKLLTKDPLGAANWSKPKRITNSSGNYETMLSFEDDSFYEVDGTKYSYRIRASITPPVTNTRWFMGAHFTSVEDRQWQGFMLQDVQIPAASSSPLHMLMVDTSDPERTPVSEPLHALRKTAWKVGCAEHRTGEKIPVVGLCGEISLVQLQHLRDLIDDLNGTDFLVMGHHPWIALRPDVRAHLMRTRASGFSGYISGHTHDEPRVTPAEDARPLEVNVGSVTDWPMNAMKLSYATGKFQPVHLPIDKARQIRFPGLPSCIYDDRAGELNHRSLTAYLGRTLIVYRRLLEWIEKQPDLKKRVQQGPDLPELDCERGGCLSYFSKLAQSPTLAKNRRKAREAIARISAYDRKVLQQVDAVRSMETSCAAWASEADSQ